MDLFKIVRSIEELLYQIVIWVLLVPKTLVRVIRSPSWAQLYVTEEIKKDPDNQFEEYMSPIMFLVAAAVLPSFVLSSLDPVEIKIPIYKLIAPNTEYKFYIHAFLWALAPLSFAYVHFRELNESINREDLKLFFYIQCYVIAPISLIIISQTVLRLAIKSSPSPESSDLIQYVSIGNSVLLLSWIFYSEISVFKANLDIGLRKAFYLVGKAILLFYILYSPVMLMTYLYLF